MQFVKNDMDDMMRKAAEHYPLDTSGAEWVRVATALQNEGQETRVTKEKKKKGRMLWLLVLLPLGLVCNHYFGVGWNGSSGNTAGTEQKNERSEPLSGTSSQKQTRQQNIIHDQEEIQNKSLPIPNEQQKMDGSFQGEDKSSIDPNTVSWNAEVKKQPAATNHKANEQGFSKITKKESSDNKNSSGSAKTNDDIFQPGQSIIENIPSNKNAGLNRVMAENFRKENDGNDLIVKNTSEINNALLEDFAKRIKENINKPKEEKDLKFYAGLMGGIDATTIKFQKIENAGFDYGALIGYRFNNRWSIEAGAFMSKKTYYTDGKHFNSKGIYLPPNTKITEVSGDCRMWEIPLSVRYTIKATEKRSWFSTIGVSSYLMKDEDYEYEYYYGSSGTSSTHYKSYKNSSQNLFSVLQLTGGYTHKIGRVGDLRIEPYLKIPVADMGVGKLPLMSAGLHIGITRKLF